jgi:hypothetical protein
MTTRIVGGTWQAEEVMTKMWAKMAAEMAMDLEMPRANL